MNPSQKVLSPDLLARLLGPWSMHINMPAVLFRVILTLVLSAVIGWERSSKRHSAGLRTFIAVALTGCAAGMLDIFILETYGSGQFFITGMVILGAAVISGYSILFNSRTQIRGLTTAAVLWSTGVCGAAIGIGLYTASLCLFAAMLFNLSVLPALEGYLKDKSNHFEVHLELKSGQYLPSFSATIRKLGMRIDDIELNPAYAGSGISVYSVSFTISSTELKKYKSHKEIIDALGSLDYIVFIEEMN